MSYIKQNFSDGQVLTAAHLNHMEDGIAAVEQTGSAELTIGTVTSGDTASASIKNSQLNLVLPKGDKGEKGDTGASGMSGLSAKMVIGTVSTLPSGQDATASIERVTGDLLNNPNTYKLHLGLPKGDAGSGSGSADLTIGTVTTAPSGAKAAATITDGKLNLVLPMGNPGLTPELNIGNVVTSDNAFAYLNKSGSNHYLLHLGLPRGEQGPAGKDGTSNTAPAYKPGKLGCVPFAQPAGSDYAQIIIYGQSLASGTETQVARTDTALDGVYMVGSSAHWYKAATLTGLNPCKNDGFESPIVAAVNHFATMYRRYRDAGQKFIANSTGLGGRSIERLSKGCTSYSYEYLYKDAFLDYLDNTKAAVTAEGKTVKCVALIFMQGEYNYDGHNKGQGFENGTDATTDKDEYKARLLQLKKDMQADVMAKYGQTEPPLFFVYQPGGAFITNGTSSINMAQQEVAAECEDVILLGSAMPCPRFAGGHMCSNGYRWQGEMIGKQLTESLLWGDAAHTVLDKAITVEGNKVYIDYEVPVPPLVADTYTVQSQPNYGFSVQMDGVGVTVEKAEVQNTRVVLTCAQELSGTVAVKYAGNAVGDRDHRGIGNLRDSDPYTSLYTYADDTSETSSAGNTIDYRPTDASGNSLNGKHYPLWNWASHAYREIIVSEIVATDFTPKISATKASVGDVLTLTVAYTPANANKGTGITWKVSDAAKVKVESGKVTLLTGSDGDTVTLTGTLENGAQHTVSITLVVSSNPYAAYYAYWDFSGGDSSNTTTVKNLVTNANDSILVGVDGSASGYLTTDGLTLAESTAVKVPIVSGMPAGMEIGLELEFPASAYNYDGMRNRPFLTLAKGSTDELECGTEKYGYAWPELRGVNAAGKTSRASWRGETDSGGTSAGNTAMWWASGTLHQRLRLRLNTSGGGELAMQATLDGDTWRTWTLPTYEGEGNQYPGFQSVKAACDTILFGNRADLNSAIAKTVLYSAYIKEYNG